MTMVDFHLFFCRNFVCIIVSLISDSSNIEYRAMSVGYGHSCRIWRTQLYEPTFPEPRTELVTSTMDSPRQNNSGEGVHDSAMFIISASEDGSVRFWHGLTGILNL